MFFPNLYLFLKFNIVFFIFSYCIADSPTTQYSVISYGTRSPVRECAEVSSQITKHMIAVLGGGVLD